MAATNYTSRNILWSFITSLADGDYVTMMRLYEEGLQRLHDGQGALLNRVARVYADLASTTTGTKAKVTGDVDMTAFNYNSGIALSGLTVIVDEDTTTAQTCTFDNAVTSPSVLLAQLTAACSTNLIWSLDDYGHLVCESQTAGVGSTIALGAGTAHTLVWGSPSITSPGSGAVNDGASRIGLGAFGSWAGGTLQSFLVAIESSVAGKLPLAGGTMTGNASFTSPAKVVYNASFSRQSKGTWHISTGSTQWGYSSPISPMFPIQMSVSSGASSVDHNIDVIPGDELDGVDVWSFSDGATHAGLPSTMPTIRLYKMASNASTPTALGPSAVQDPSADATEYDALHKITITGLAETIAANTRYFVRYTSEDGTNELANRTLLAVVINGTSKGVPPGV